VNECSGNNNGQAFRDLEWEAKVHKITQNMGIGAQFGGKAFHCASLFHDPLPIISSCFQANISATMCV
jgi:hypothetical protein